MRGLDTVYSSARTGFGRVFLNFKTNTDMDVAYREVRDRIERARVRFPDDIDRVYASAAAWLGRLMVPNSCPPPIWLMYWVMRKSTVMNWAAMVVNIR